MKKIYLLFIFFGLIKIFPQKQLTVKQIDSMTNVLWFPKLNTDERLAKITELYYQAKEIDYTKGQLRLLIKTADLKAGKLDYVGALDAIKTLKPLSLSAGSYEDYISGCGIEAKIFFLDHNYSQAKRVLHQAEKYLSGIHDEEKRRKAKLEIYIYQWYNFEKSKIPKSSYPDSLLSISKKMYKEAILIKNDYHRADRVLFSANLITTSLILLKRYKEAGKYITIGGRQLEKAGKETYLSADYYEAKGDIEYYDKKNKNYSLDSALASYNMAVKIGEKLEYTARTKELYSKIAKIYENKKDQKSEITFLKKSKDLKDSIEIIKDNALNEVKPILYNANNIIENEEPSFQNKFIILYSLLGLFVLALVGYGAKEFYLKKGNNKKESLEKSSSEENPTSESYSYYHLIKLFINNDSSFYLNFLKIYPDFGEKLLNINPTLKSSDIEFCAYIKLNLDTKQIAQYKKISVRAVEGKKYRIRKKLNIMPDDNMYIWISKL